MLEICIDGIMHKFSSNNKSVADILGEIIPTERIVSKVELNNSTYNVFTKTKAQYSNDLLSISQKIANDTLELIHECVEEIKNSDSYNHLHVINSHLENLIQFIIEIQTTSKASISDKLKNNTDIKNLKIHLLSIVKGIYQAHQKDDKAMLCDLIEFELKDNLTQWKIKVIPQLKQSISH